MTMPDNTGYVIQVTGLVVDVQFFGGRIPPIYRVLQVEAEGKHEEVPEQALGRTEQVPTGNRRTQP